MTMRNLSVLPVIPQQRATATVTGAAVDLAAYTNVGGREMKAIMTVLRQGADADETCDVKLQESHTTTSGDFVDISGAAFAQQTQPGATPGVTAELHFRAQRRYIRAVATLAGTTPAFDLALVVLAEERQAA
jgi:hypothetical protein